MAWKGFPEAPQPSTPSLVKSSQGHSTLTDPHVIAACVSLHTDGEAWRHHSEHPSIPQRNPALSLDALTSASLGEIRLAFMTQSPLSGSPP